MAENLTAILEWKGREYELRYSLALVRRVRAEGVNIPRLFREISASPINAVDYGDEIALVVASALRDAGAQDVTTEEVWRLSLSDQQFCAQCLQLLLWIGGQHFAVSENVPKNPEARRQ